MLWIPHSTTPWSQIGQVLSGLPARPNVRIDHPKGSMIKRRSDGTVDFVSPLPCPYNYGCIPGRVSGDGDDLDAIVWGERLAWGTTVQYPALAVVGFVDEGMIDPKLVCGEPPLLPADVCRLQRFFVAYALFKRSLATLRRRSGPTGFLGIRPLWHRDEPPLA